MKHALGLLTGLLLVPVTAFAEPMTDEQVLAEIKAIQALVVQGQGLQDQANGDLIAMRYEKSCQEYHQVMALYRQAKTRSETLLASRTEIQGQDIRVWAANFTPLVTSTAALEQQACDKAHNSSAPSSPAGR